jgi:hypothetical protein
MVLEVIFWVLLLLSLIGFAPAPWAPRVSWGIAFVLFIILGLKVFGVPH